MPRCQRDNAIIPGAVNRAEILIQLLYSQNRQLLRVVLTRLVLGLLDAWIYTEGPGIGLVPRKSHALLYRQTKFQLVTQHWLPIDITMSKRAMDFF